MDKKFYEFDNFTSGEYVKKEEVMRYLRDFDWDMPREELIEIFKDIPTININEENINRIKTNMILNRQ